MDGSQQELTRNQVAESVVFRGLGIGALGGLVIGTTLGLPVMVVGAIFGAPIGTAFGSIDGLVCGIALAVTQRWWRKDRAPSRWRARAVSVAATFAAWVVFLLILIAKGSGVTVGGMSWWGGFTALAMLASVLLTTCVIGDGKAKVYDRYGNPIRRVARAQRCARRRTASGSSDTMTA
jgi:hypothetical protein